MEGLPSGAEDGSTEQIASLATAEGRDSRMGEQLPVLNPHAAGFRRITGTQWVYSDGRYGIGHLRHGKSGYGTTIKAYKQD